MLTNTHLLQAFEALGASTGVLYMSVPITSGRREVALLDELGVSVEVLRSHHRDRWTREVLEANGEVARNLGDRLRADNPGRLVVNPAHMSVGGWAQDDYNAFWVTLMERYATSLAATPGWEFSRGARGEVGFAVALGRPVVDLSGSTLDIETLRAHDASARAELSGLGWSDCRIESYLPALDFEGKPAIEPSPQSKVFEWLIREREYQVRKFGIDLDDQHTREGLGEDGWWWRQLTTYYHRAGVLGLASPVGRQALAKYVATACGLLESVFRVHGTLPPPGVPSGELNGDP